MLFDNAVRRGTGYPPAGGQVLQPNLPAAPQRRTLVGVVGPGNGRAAPPLARRFGGGNALGRAAADVLPLGLGHIGGDMLSFQEVMKYNESSNKDEPVEGILWRNYNG